MPKEKENKEKNKDKKPALPDRADEQPAGEIVLPVWPESSNSDDSEEDK